MKTKNTKILAALILSVVVSSSALANDNPKSHDTYYVSDALATTISTVSAAGEIAQIEADAFGSPISPSGVAVTRYTGKPYDDDIGAYIFPFRNFRPNEARWTSADPSGFPDGTNQYIYASNPLSSVDALGLSASNIGTRDVSFVTHYYLPATFGGGSYLDISDKLSLSEILSNGGQGMLTNAKNDAHASAATQNRGSFSGHNSDIFYPDMETVVFSVGNTTINAAWNWTGSIDSKGYYSFTGKLSFLLSDSFSDVLDFNDTQPGNQEAGGTPYAFGGSWKTTFSGKGHLE